MTKRSSHLVEVKPKSIGIVYVTELQHHLETMHGIAGFGTSSDHMKRLHAEKHLLHAHHVAWPEGSVPHTHV